MKRLHLCTNPCVYHSILNARQIFHEELQEQIQRGKDQI